MSIDKIEEIYVENEKIYLKDERGSIWKYDNESFIHDEEREHVFEMANVISDYIRQEHEEVNNFVSVIEERIKGITVIPQITKDMLQIRYSLYIQNIEESITTSIIYNIENNKVLYLLPNKEYNIGTLMSNVNQAKNSIVGYLNNITG